MTDARTQQAALNNALWCDAVSRAQGRPGEANEVIWWSSQETPPFYPNAVTLVGREGVTEQQVRIRSLVASALLGEWAVKDSFFTLNLAPLGFRPLFEAEWVWRPASLPAPDMDEATARWRVISSDAELAEWEIACPACSGSEGGTEIGRVFLPPLLTDENIAVIAAYQGDKIVAGAVASHAAGVVGLSNIFLSATDAEGLRAGCVSQAMQRFPGLALVGYEVGADLAGTQVLGFEALGPLRIWIRNSI